jgi:ceramide glucosyltransferase
LVIVRPFRGADVDAKRKHETLVSQTYAPSEVIFVCDSPNDPGVPDAMAACALAPSRARLLFAAEDATVVSGKALNMIAAWNAAPDAELVAFCDSDLALDPDDVGRCIALLDEDPRAGAAFVPCLFDAEGPIGRMIVLTATVDGSVFIRASGVRGDTPILQGGLVVVRRDALERAGGIRVVADAIADDLRLGRALREAGFTVRATTHEIVHSTPREGMLSWSERYHRWMTCQRTDNPRAFFAMLLLHPLVLPLVAAAASPTHRAAMLWATGVSAVFESLFTLGVERMLLRPRGIRLGAWILARPLATIVHFVFCVAALFYPIVTWRGRRYVVGLDGRARVADLGIGRRAFGRAG